MKWTLFLLLQLLAVYFAAGARAEKTVLVLHQTYSLMGKQITYVSPDQVVIKSDLATVILRVKEDRVYIYSDKRKCYADLPYSSATKIWTCCWNNRHRHHQQAKLQANRLNRTRV